MKEIKIINVPFDEDTELFDDDVLRNYLLNRELLRAEPSFFVKDGKPYWSVFIETNMLRGPTRHGCPSTAKLDEKAEQNQKNKASHELLLKDLDEIGKARYKRLIHWRSSSARKEGIPPYVLFSNREGQEIARQAPKTSEELLQIKGIGKKRVKKHGREILEVLHGPKSSGGTGQTAPVRAVDGNNKVASGENQEVSEKPETHPE